MKKVYTSEGVNKTLIENYINEKSDYEELTSTTEHLLRVLLEGSTVKYQKIESRTKSVQGLKNKLHKKSLEEKSYQKLNAITDLSGIRIIVFFKSDINKITDILEKEFYVHHEQSVDMDRGIAKKPKEFGYQSEHRIVSINQERSKLQEYKKFQGMKCEVQIRTVLQHAWAEIEHGIGYKSEIQETDEDRTEITRIFSQNAALLEVADDNFVIIRSLYDELLKKYRADIAEDNFDLPINFDSMREYLDKYENIENYALLNTRTRQALKQAKEQNIYTLKGFDKAERKKVNKKK